MRSVAVSVVIPAQNEAENLPHVLPRIPPDVHEVILVDGSSTDGTIEVARRLLPRIRIVQEDRRGKGAALRTGFAVATGDIIVHLDADGSTDPAEIPAFVGCLLGGADYAKGTRFMQGASTSDITPLRRLGNWAFVKLANLLFGTQFSDITYGYNAIWRRHCDKLALEIDGWANEIISNIRLARHGLRVVEVASREWPRLAGQPKLQTFPAGWTILNAIVAERFKSVPSVTSAWTDLAPAGDMHPMRRNGNGHEAPMRDMPAWPPALPAMPTVQVGGMVPLPVEPELVPIPIMAYEDFHTADDGEARRLPATN